MWYCAHAIFCYKKDEGDSTLVHENVYLIDAADEDSALEVARDLAKSNEDLNEDGHLELDGRPAKYLFLGIRKLIAIETNPDTAQGIINSGIELTYSVFQAQTLKDAERLANGEEVDVQYQE